MIEDVFFYSFGTLDTILQMLHCLISLVLIK